MTEAGRLTAVLDVDDSKLTAGLSKARQTASTAIAGIEQDANRSLSGAFAGVGGGLQHSLSKGSFRDVGKTLGADLVQGITAPLGSMGTTAASIATAMGPVGIAAVAGTAAIVGLGAASARAAMDWQSMSTSIGRTTGLEGTNLSNLMNSLQELRMQMGLSREGAAAMAEAAGSLGVGERWMTKFEKTGDASALNQYKKEIVDYVSVIGKVSTAWGMSNETASQSIGAMASVTLSTWNKQREGAGEQAITWDEYAKKVGGSIDLLGNKMGSSEQGIVTAMTHIGSSVADLAPSEETYAKWTGLASFMVEKMPQSADTAGEAIKDAMTYIQRDQEGAVSGLLGIDQPTLIKKMKTDAVGTIREIGKAVASMPEAERSKLLSGSTFGQTGGQLIKQVVADELSGTGRLDYAIDVSVEGFDHSKIDQGFESVMGDATQQANRVVQVFQVGLEKIGTVTLPAITGGLKAVADTGEWMVEKGSDAWGFASQRNEDANKAFVEGGLVEGFKTLFFGPDQTAQVAEGVAEGAEEGLQKGAEAAAPAMAEAVGNALQGEMEKAYKDLIAKGISKEIASAMAYGGATTDTEALAIINGSQSGSWKQALSSQFARSLGGLPGLDPYQISEWTYKSSNKSKLLATTASGDLIDSFNSSKGLITEDAYDAWVKGLQPGILDTNLYFQAHTPEIRDAIAQAWKDGAISGTEKGNLVGLKQSLEDLKVKFSGEFDRAGLQRELDQVSALVAGKPIELEVRLKSVWEDWSSEQYKAQYRYENQDWMKWMSPGQSDQFIETAGKLYEASLSGNAQDKIAWDNFAGALKGIESGFSGQTESEREYFEQSIITMQGIAPALANVLSRLYSQFGTLSARNPITDPEKYYNYGYTPRYNPTSFTSTLSRRPVLSPNFLNKYGSGITYFDGSSPEVAIVGDSEELIIPVDAIKGLYPKSNNAKKGSMEYYSGDRYFEDYPHKITPPVSYRWGHYPDAPNVGVTGNVPMSWLSDQQKSGMDWISSEVRKMQLESIGRSQVMPWFARGYSDQPGWWSSAASAISPQYASAWSAQKGGELPKIGPDAGDFQPYDAWAAIYDDSGTCIAYNKPDPSLKFTPGEKFRGPSGGFAPVYGANGKVSAFVESGTFPTFSTAPTGLNGNFPFAGGKSFLNGAPMTFGTPQVSPDLARSSWNAIYDNRGTCIAFVPPDPSLNFTPGKDYMPGGKGFGNMGIGYESYGDQEIQTWDSVDSSLKDVCDNTKETAENTKETASAWSGIFPMLGSLAGPAAMVAGVFGGGGSGLAGWGSGSRIGGSYGSAFGGWYTGGAANAGGGASFGSGGIGGIGGFASGFASGGGGGSIGGVSFGWAEGGLINSPELFMADGRLSIRGEAGPELILPLSNPSRTRELLARYLPDVRPFAAGGLVGGKAAAGKASGGNYTFNYSPVIQGAGLSEDQLSRLLEKERQNWMDEISQKLYNDQYS